MTTTIDNLIAQLYDTHDSVRRDTVGSLAVIGEPAISSLVAVLKNYKNNWWTRQSAFEALVKIGGATIVETLITALKDPNESIRQSAIYHLDKIGDAKTIEPLIATLMDSSQHIRFYAARALDKLGWQPGQDEDGAAYWIANEKPGKCIKIGSPAIKPLITCLDLSNFRQPSSIEEDIRLKVRIIETLGAIHDSRVLEILREAKKYHKYETGSGWDSVGESWRAPDNYDFGGPVREAAKNALESIEAAQRK